MFLQNRDQFWNEVKKVTSVKQHIVNCIDGQSGSKDICSVFGGKYANLFTSVPTADGELADTCIKEYIEGNVALSDCKVLVQVVCEAVMKLKKNKCDSAAGVCSSHFVHMPIRCIVYISLLFSSMLIHGCNANDMLSSVIVSILKDVHGSMSDSSNYRGIALCSTLSKLLDYIVLSKYKNELSSSDLQYAFKEGHSTSMCSVVLKEVVGQYVSRWSNVFACLLDASKAFDLVQYGKLFRLLIKLNLPPAVIRLLLDSYMRHTMCCTWNGQYFERFSTTNGVKQGGVLLPVLFTAYLDELLLK